MKCNHSTAGLYIRQTGSILKDPSVHYLVLCRFIHLVSEQPRPWGGCPSHNTNNYDLFSGMSLNECE